VAGTLLHIALAEQALSKAKITGQSRRELTGHLQDFRLGAILADLPYHDRICRSGLRSLMKLDLHYNTWGTLLHMRSPLGLTLALLNRANDSPGRALALGFLTHFSVDVVFHSEISALVNTEADGSRSLDMEHRRIEEQMDLHVHYSLLGHSGMGTPYASRMLWLKPDSSWCGRALSAIAEIHGNAPDIATLKRWKNELAIYGALSSTKKVPWIKTIPKDDPALQKKSLDLAEESIRLAAKHIELGLQYLGGNVTREDFLTAIPDLSMMDGGPSAPPRRK
jgi:hypothetical protein